MRADPRSLAAALALSLLACREPKPDASDEPPDPLLVSTELGPIRGQQQGRVHAFRGVPYAAAPVGALRFRPPAPVIPWIHVRNTRAFGPPCPQIGVTGELIGDEDCLTLNVWRPAAVAERPRPVLVFIHGGANVVGSSADPLGDGRHLAAQHDVIVVTFNYRLGLLGFFAHPQLTEESGSSGNWAHLDQIAALEWVMHNIAAFGGDPDRITIVGESAGATSVCVLLASPLASGMFAGAIMHSGSCDVAPLEQREREGERLLEISGCAAAGDRIECLRTLPAANLVAFARASVPGWWGADEHTLPLGGAVDGHVLADGPLSVFAAGTHVPVPTLIGTNAEEASLFVPREFRGCEAYVTEIRARFGELADAVLAAYPCHDDADARTLLVQALTDAMFSCPSRRVLRTLAGAATPVFRHVYAYARADPAIHELGAFHGSELQLLFGTMARLGYEVPEHERALADIMQQSWVALARTGSPIHAGTPSWQPYEAARDNAVIFDAPTIRTIEGVGTERCDFWDRAIDSPAQNE